MSECEHEILRKEDNVEPKYYCPECKNYFSTEQAFNFRNSELAHIKAENKHLTTQLDDPDLSKRYEATITLLRNKVKELKILKDDWIRYLQSSG